MTHRRYLIAFILAASWLGVAPSRLHADPPDGPSWKPVPALSDEFSGTQLDPEKWHNHNPQWVGRPPVYFHPDCVAVRDGMLRLTALNHQDSAARNPPRRFTHLSGFVKGKTPIRYGYFELKAKLMDSTLVSGFWLYQHTDAEWTEIDIFEVPAGVPGRRDKLHTNVHVFHSPAFREAGRGHYQDSRPWRAPSDLADDFHVYGLEWTADRIRWFVDGKVIRTRKNEYWHQPLHLNINNESNDWFDARPDDKRLPATYEIDYVRTWTIEE